MTYRIMKTKYCILTRYDIKWRGGGGQVIFHVVSRGWGGGSLDLNFARRGGGVIQNSDDRSKFQPAP